MLHVTLKYHICRHIKTIKIQSMKKSLLMAFVAGSVLLASCGETKTEAPVVKVPETPLMGEAKLTIDPAASKVVWGGNMTGVKIYGHEGTVNIKEGSVSLKDGKVVTGSFTMDMTSIKPTDANYGEKEHTVAELIGHLSSPDFFDIANNPTSNFAITSVNGNTVSGNLTIRGKSNPETIEISSIALEGENVKISGKMTFDRQKYGVAFAMPGKDLLLSDDITISVDLVGKKG
jgi:polyisoprenoid-binding protein YceI